MRVVMSRSGCLFSAGGLAVLQPTYETRRLCLRSNAEVDKSEVINHQNDGRDDDARLLHLFQIGAVEHTISETATVLPLLIQ